MDILSNLLQEARPLYLEYKRKSLLCMKCGCVITCLCIIVTSCIISLQYDYTSIDSMYTYLYTDNNDQVEYYIDEFDAMGVI